MGHSSPNSSSVAALRISHNRRTARRPLRLRDRPASYCGLPPTMRSSLLEIRGAHAAAPHHLSGGCHAPPPPATAVLEIGATVAAPIVSAAPANAIASNVFMSALPSELILVDPENPKSHSQYCQRGLQKFSSL